MTTPRRHAIAFTTGDIAIYGTIPAGVGQSLKVYESPTVAHAVWIVSHAGAVNLPLHLDRAGAEALIAALQRFLADEAAAEPPADATKEL